MKFDDKTRKLIQERARDRCEICGMLAVNHQVHHRRPRGMGGSKNPATGGAANGLWVHPRCHSMVESERAEAKTNGWLVSQYDTPENVPVKRYNGWFILKDDGSLTPVSPDNLGGGDTISPRSDQDSDSSPV